MFIIDIATYWYNTPKNKIKTVLTTIMMVYSEK